MRLKFLFFPIVLVISLSIFIGYIWPEINNLKKENAKKLEYSNELKSIADKQAAIGSIGSQLDSDSAGGEIINNYLPSKRVEERILAGVNFLATDSGVSLVNISLEDVDTKLSADQLVSSTGVESEVKESSIQFTQVAITINGEYEKIRLFMDQLQQMPIFNNVKSLTISAKPPLTAVEIEEGGQANDLLANIVIDFGYMNLVKMDNGEIANFDPTLDGNISAIVKKHISQKIQSPEGSGDSNGKNNPFIR